METLSFRRFQAKVIMSFMYGYDLKENDDIIQAPVQLSQIIGRFFYPEAALVNFLPSRKNTCFVVTTKKTG